MKRVVQLVFVILIGLSTNVYAQQADWLLNQLLSQFPVSGKVQYKNPSGGLTQGTLEQLIYDGHNLGELSWTLDTKAFASGKIAAHFILGKGSPYKISAKGYAMVGKNKILYIKDVKASMPAASVMTLSKWPSKYQPTGNVNIVAKSGSFKHGQRYCETLDAEAVWTQAKLKTPYGKVDVKTVRADLGCKKHAITVYTEQASNQFTGKADITLQPNNQYKLIAWLKPNRTLPSKVRKILSSMGKPTKHGKIVFNKSGKI